MSVSDKDIVRVFAFFLVIFKLNILILLKPKVYFHFNFSPYFLVCAESWDTFRFNFVHYGSRDHLFTTQILPFSAHLRCSLWIKPSKSSYYIFLSLVEIYRKFYPVSFRLISFRFDRFRLISFRFVSIGFSFGLVWFRFVSFLFRFALYRYPVLWGIFWNELYTAMLLQKWILQLYLRSMPGKQV